MPKPRKGESQSDFISRCMGDLEAKRTRPKQDERLGLCYGLWAQAKEDDDYEEESGEEVGETDD